MWFSKSRSATTTTVCCAIALTIAACAAGADTARTTVTTDTGASTITPGATTPEATTPATEGTGTTPAEPTTTAADDELSLVVTTADDLAVNTLVDILGATLTTAAGPITYTLVIPPGAVMSPVQVTMTPITSITGTPFEQPAAGGVMFAPEGLMLADPALLTITGGPPTQGALGFGFDGSGNGFHLVPFIPGDDVVLPVRHFSGYAYATATLVEAGRMATLQIANEFDALDHEVALYLATEPSTTDPEFETTMKKFADDQEQLVTEALTAAETDPLVLGPTALAQTLGAYRQSQLQDEDPRPLPIDAITSLIDKADAALEKICTERSADPEATLTAVLASARMHQFIGIGTDLNNQQLQALLDKCNFTFEVNPTKIIVFQDYEWSGTALPSPSLSQAVLSGPITPLVADVSWSSVCPEFTATNPIPPGLDPDFCKLRRVTYKWKANVVLTVSEFTDAAFCYTGAPVIVYPGFEPTLAVEMYPDLNVTQQFSGSVAPTADAAVILDLLNGFGVPYSEEPDTSCDRTQGEQAFNLDDAWGAVGGPAPRPMPFAGGTIAWSAQSTPGEFANYLGDLGYFQVTTDVTFSTKENPASS